MNLKAIVWVKRALQTLLWVSVWALLFTVCLGGNYLPPGQTDFQKLWTGKMGIFFTIVYVLCLAFNIHKKLAKAVCWGLIVTGGIQAVWGILQIYGWCASQHPLFQLTGSFYNPGPYAGYLAFVFPLSLYKVLILHQLKQRSRIENVLYATALAVGILILAVLPASMSRSAWLAAFLTGPICIYCTKRGVRMVGKTMEAKSQMGHNILLFYPYHRYKHGHWRILFEKRLCHGAGVHVENYIIGDS